MFNRDVPTLAYVWTSSQLPEDAVVDSPYHPGTVRSIVLRSGGEHLGRWAEERRNVLSDFRKAFGRAPPAAVSVVALFPATAQTGEPGEAFSRALRALPPYASLTIAPLPPIPPMAPHLYTPEPRETRKN